MNSIYQGLMQVALLAVLVGHVWISAIAYRQRDYMLWVWVNPLFSLYYGWANGLWYPLACLAGGLLIVFVGVFTA